MRSERAVSGFLCSAMIILQGTIAYGEDTLKDLVGTKIYSASKKEEDPAHSPSAIYVITADDIKQMGVRHVADALRTVPGLQVAKISSNKWTIASRGFGEQFSNKLLVMIDGRPIYTSLFSGVLWDQQDLPIEDIKQIEVIRGPGATLWGSNAVSGVINIITKSSRDTLGTQIKTTVGFTDKGKNETVVEAREGVEVKDWGTARATLRMLQEPSYEAVNPTIGYNDKWRSGSANFRYDQEPSADHSLSVQGAIFANDVNQTYRFPTLSAPFSRIEQGTEQSHGAHILGTLTQEKSDSSQVTVRSYLDYTDWRYTHFNPKFVNMGLDGQYDFLMLDKFETVVGIGYKLTVDDIQDGTVLNYDPSSYAAQFLDAFIQTKIPLIEKELDLIVGSKVESNTYDDFELSPSTKLSWYPNHFFTGWLSWSQAHRIPSRGTRALTTLVRGTPGGYIGLIPNKDFKPESLNSYEAGIRVNAIKGLHVDSSIFYDHYENLRTFLPGPPVGGSIAVPLYLGNAGEAENKGFEVSATYQTSPTLKLDLGFSHADLDFATEPGANDTVFQSGAAKWPNNMWSTRIAYQATDDISINGSLYYSADMPAISIGNYTKADGNIAWNVLDNAELTLGIDNIADELRPEYSAPLGGERTKVPRLYYLTFKYSM